MKHWLPYSELANTKRVTREEFRKALSKLPRSGVLIACARLSSIFDYGPDANTVASDEATISWIPNLLPPPLVDRALSFLRQGRVIFFQGQLRYLAAEVMRLQKNDIESDTYFPDILIGPLLLCAGELLYTPQPMQTKDLDKMAGLVAMFLPIYEIDSLMDPFMLFVRFYIFLTICIPRLPKNLQTFDPYVEFDKVFHLPLKSYYIMVFTMMMNGLMYRGSGRLEGAPLGGSFGKDWYKETNLTDKQLDHMFNSVSFTLADLPDNKEPIGFADFETLRDKPYFRHKDQMYCLDYEYAVGKLESGVIWRVRSSLPDKKRLAYFSFWGEVFEEYIAWLFEEYAHKQLNQFYRSPKGPDGLPLCDAVVVHGCTAILIETKLGTCAANVRYACDYKKMREFLEDKLVSGTNRDVGVQQLLRAVKTISSNKIDTLPACLRGIKKLIPLLITRDDIGSSWMTNGYLNARFQESLIRKACKPYVVTPLVSMSVGTLERGLDALQKMALCDILQQRIRDDEGMQRPFEAASHYISRGTRRTPKHIALLDDLIKEMTAEFGMRDDEVGAES